MFFFLLSLHLVESQRVESDPQNSGARRVLNLSQNPSPLVLGLIIPGATKGRRLNRGCKFNHFKKTISLNSDHSPPPHHPLKSDLFACKNPNLFSPPKWIQRWRLVHGRSDVALRPTSRCRSSLWGPCPRCPPAALWRNLPLRKASPPETLSSGNCVLGGRVQSRTTCRRITPSR